MEDDVVAELVRAAALYEDRPRGYLIKPVHLAAGIAARPNAGAQALKPCQECAACLRVGGVLGHVGWTNSTGLAPTDRH